MRGNTLLGSLLVLGGCALLVIGGCAARPAPFTEACTRTLESAGGRGSDSAGPLCACMDQAATEHEGDKQAIMRVAAAPKDEKGVVFDASDQLTRRIIGACLRRLNI